MQKRIVMKLSRVERMPMEGAWPLATVSGEDAGALGELMLDAYAGTVDYAGETLDEAIAEVTSCVRGSYGRFLDDLSFAVRDIGRIASASLVTWSEDFGHPLLAFLMTAAHDKGKGLGSHALRASINALADAGHEALYLVVTDANTPAVRLYEKFGFRKVEQ